MKYIYKISDFEAHYENQIACVQTFSSSNKECTRPTSKSKGENESCFVLGVKTMEVDSFYCMLGHNKSTTPQTQQIGVGYMSSNYPSRSIYALNM